MKYHYNKIVLIICCSILLTIQSYAAVQQQIRQGNRKYHTEHYTDAQNCYNRAQVDAPDMPIIDYNLGNVYYRLGNYEMAIDAYNKAIGSKDAQLRCKAYHNIGNTYFQQSNYQSAIENYKESLRINPDNADTKYNYALAIKKLSEQQQQTNQQQQKQNNHNKRRNKQNNAQGQQQQQNGKHNNDRQNYNDENTVVLNEEQARKILDDVEKETDERRIRIRLPGRSKEKDW